MRKTIAALLATILMACLLATVGPAGAADRAVVHDPGIAIEPVYWYEFGVKKQAWPALDELAIFPARGSRDAVREGMLQTVSPGAEVIEDRGFVIIFKASGQLQSLDFLAAGALGGVNAAMPVCYSSGLKSASDRMIPTGEILVQYPADMSPNEILDLETAHGLSRVREYAFAPNSYAYRPAAGADVFDAANALYESGRTVFAYPDWLRPISPRLVPNDPLFLTNQWTLNNTGQGGGTAGEDAGDFISVWDTFRGSANEVIAIIDNGLETTHPDLAGNIVPGLSHDYVDGDADPLGPDAHGTSCAGVAAARGNNGLGVTGAAPSAGLTGYRLIGADTDNNTSDAMVRNSGVVDIASNSWGPTDDGRRLEGPGPLTLAALANGVETGRGGLGMVYVWAGGNGALSADNSNFDGFANNRFVIAVSASTNQGFHAAGYSERGANILINAPSSGGTLDVTTTDLTGAAGAAAGDYRTNFVGTSAAAPLVAGVAALMLEANPSLTWRDVRHILIRTADRNDPGDADWTVNGAGFPINHKFGFGRVNVAAAVAAAATWTQVGALVTAQGSSSPNLLIPDNNAVGVSDSITIPDNLSVEFAEVFFTAADHTFWRDLEVSLVSPSGTVSVLAEAANTAALATPSYNNWRFGSVRHFGESTQGTWTLRVRDLRAPSTGRFQSWTLVLHGSGTIAAGGGGGGGCFIETAFGD